MSRAELDAALSTRPPGAYRAKGHVQALDGASLIVQVVGQMVEIRQGPAQPASALVLIGPAGVFDPADAESWWQRALEGAR